METADEVADDASSASERKLSGYALLSGEASGASTLLSAGVGVDDFVVSSCIQMFSSSADDCSHSKPSPAASMACS